MMDFIWIVFESKNVSFRFEFFHSSSALHSERSRIEALDFCEKFSTIISFATVLEF